MTVQFRFLLKGGHAIERAIFYMRGIGPSEIALMDMYRGVVPFIVLEVIALAMVMIFPELALWLPAKLLGIG